jgi:hypothetical protein
MGLWDTIKNVHPINPAADAIDGAITVGQPIKVEPLPKTGQVAADQARKDAIAAGKAPQQEAIKRGRGE